MQSQNLIPMMCIEHSFYAKCPLTKIRVCSHLNRCDYHILGPNIYAQFLKPS